jgi:phage shock protein A
MSNENTTTNEIMEFLKDTVATKSDLKVLETKIETLDTKVEALDTKVEALDTKVGALDTKVNTLPTKSYLDDKMADLKVVYLKNFVKKMLSLNFLLI